MPSATFPAPVTLDTLPANGSKSVSVRIAWADVAVNTGRSLNDNRVIYTINLLSQFQSGQFDTCQSVYIDNLTSSYGVVLTSAESGQRLSCPPFSAGSFILLCGPAPSFTVEILTQFVLPDGSNLDNSSTTLHFLNTPGRTFIDTGSGIYPVNAPVVFTSAAPFVGDTLVILAGELGTPSSPGSLDVDKHYLVNGIALSVVQPNVGTGPTAQLAVSLIQTGNTGPFILWQARFVSLNTAFAEVYDTVTIFPQPILVSDGGNALAVQTAGFTAGGVQHVLVVQLFLSIVRIA